MPCARSLMAGTLLLLSTRAQQHPALTSTNPRDSGPKSSFVKCGSVRWLKPKGMRLPSTFCCPTHAIIWQQGGPGWGWGWSVRGGLAAGKRGAHSKPPPLHHALLSQKQHRARSAAPLITPCIPTHPHHTTHPRHPPPPTCEMLMKDPLDPAVTMRTTLLVSCRLCCAMLPASSRALLSTWLTCRHEGGREGSPREVLASRTSRRPFQAHPPTQPRCLRLPPPPPPARPAGACKPAKGAWRDTQHALPRGRSNTVAEHNH